MPQDTTIGRIPVPVGGDKPNGPPQMLAIVQAMETGGAGMMYVIFNDSAQRTNLWGSQAPHGALSYLKDTERYAARNKDGSWDPAVWHMGRAEYYNTWAGGSVTIPQNGNVVGSGAGSPTITNPFGADVPFRVIFHYRFNISGGDQNCIYEATCTATGGGGGTTTVRGRAAYIFSQTGTSKTNDGRHDATSGGTVTLGSNLKSYTAGGKGGGAIPSDGDYNAIVATAIPL